MTTTVEVSVSDNIATITFNRPRSLNAITKEGLQIPQARSLSTFIFLDYDAFANALRDIDKRSDVLVTIWQGEFSILLAQELTDPTQISDWQVLLRVRSLLVLHLLFLNYCGGERTLRIALQLYQPMFEEHSCRLLLRRLWIVVKR
jgi:hypothetical protein